ncbi:MAG: phytanoyl-CoA dioxygenase family protein [Chitinophagales bacterium]|nr:phytanoyl-CoA dioxygenase family protein [Chitinophagales bacterium]
MLLYAKFKNAEIEDSLNEYGFVHLPGFLSGNEVHEFYALFQSLHTNNSAGQNMWNSLYDLPNGKGVAASEQLKEKLAGKFSGWLHDFKMPVVTYMVKNPTAESNCELHRDNSAFDETRFEYRNGWIPLVDINEKNGALYVLPKSNHVFDYCLPMATEWQYKSMTPELMKHVHVVYAKAGDLVVYKDKMLHGSFHNHTTQPRPVLHFGLLHPEASTCYYRRNQQENRVDVFSVQPDFFFEKDFEQALAGRKPEQSFPYNPPELRIEDVLEKIK